MVTITAAISSQLDAIVLEAQKVIRAGDNAEEEADRLTAELLQKLLGAVYPALKLVDTQLNQNQRGVILCENFDGPGRVLCIVRGMRAVSIIEFSVATRYLDGPMGSTHTGWDGKALVRELRSLSKGSDDEFVKRSSALIASLLSIFRRAMEKNEERHKKMAELADRIQQGLGALGQLPQSSA